MMNEAVPKIARHKRGFTLLELLVVMAIMGSLASIAVPVYIKYVNQAKNTICMNDIRSIQQELDVFRGDNGRLPNCLDELSGGNRLDPWRNPYQFLNYEAVGEDVPAGGAGGGGGGSGGGGGGGGGKAGGSGGGGGGGGGSEKKEEGTDCSSNSDGGGKEKVRKDRYLNPLNTDYDLYSKGADGDSRAPLTAKASHDDIIRASDGQYIGIAANF